MTWAKIPYVGMITQMLRLKSHVSIGEADLTLFLLIPRGEILGTYIGKSTFNETFNPLPTMSLRVRVSIEPCPKLSIKFRTRSRATCS